jgi:deoxyribodipyrimidine photo-lyase
MHNKSIFWHRRDLRISDNAGLYKALKNSKDVQPIFIFDKNILDLLSVDDQRVIFIHQEIQRLKIEYQSYSADLKVYYGCPLELIPQIVSEYQAEAVYINRDYEPYALQRDQTIFDTLKEKNISFVGSKDHVIFEKNEILKDDGKPYTIFTPYSKKWKSLLSDYYLKPYPTEKYLVNLITTSEPSILMDLKMMGFSDKQKVEFPERIIPNEIIKSYHDTRDIPAVSGTTRLSLHLRFGTISIRHLAKLSLEINEKYLNELIWRDFYQMIIFHFPYSVKNSFKPQYDQITWEKNDTHFIAWCQGKTGYPLVDAGMRELNETGFMHNRVRMVVASFLTKHLLLDWRLGEAYFAEKLLDFELASNIGGWQWAAGCGCDAAPYFRIFNPTSQQNKFDPKGNYIRRWIPEIDTLNYPEPIIEHKFARERVLERFKSGLGKV